MFGEDMIMYRVHRASLADWTYVKQAVGLSVEQ